MKFVRFINNKNNSSSLKPELGVAPMDNSFLVPFSKVDFLKKYSDMVEFIKEADDNLVEKIKTEVLGDNVFSSTDCLSFDDVDLLSPMEKPVHDVICVGVNYRDHLEECNDRMTMIHAPATVYFSKRASKFIGPFDDIDGNLEVDTELDYEVELAVVIGKEGKNISKENCYEHIFGYSILNDVSARSLQRSHSQWYRGKSLDGFTVFGPCIVHKSSISHPVELNIKSFLNDEERQNSNTKLLIKDIPSLISEFSTGLTLEPGDIIATGTPSGVGMGFEPPKYMKKNDKIVCYIENIGQLENVVK